jgi:hypothetical protein
VIRERKIYGQMWPSHGKRKRAGFRVTLRAQPSREQKIKALATPELYGTNGYATCAVRGFSTRASRCTRNDQNKDTFSAASAHALRRFCGVMATTSEQNESG